MLIYISNFENLIIWNVPFVKVNDFIFFKTKSVKDPCIYKMKYTLILSRLVDQLWIILRHFSYSLMIFLNKENNITYSIYPLSELRALT
jgi:hypothetical protein